MSDSDPTKITTKITLLDFLRARLGEMEAEADQIHTDLCTFSDHPPPCICALPEYVRADVASKRALIRAIFEYEERIDGEWGCSHDASEIERNECPGAPVDQIYALQLLALPYATHPDYHKREWRTELWRTGL